MIIPQHWQEADVQANGIRLHYYRSGGDKPQVVLAHGYSDDALCWLPVARELQRYYDIILYDARGHGLSEAPEHGYSYLDRGNDLLGLIAALNLQLPVLMGHSMGAQSAAICAGIAPRDIKAILLEDPPWMEPEEAVRRGRVRDASWMSREREHISERSRHTLEEQVILERGMNTEWSDEEVLQAARARLLMSPHNAETIADPPPAWREVAVRIQCPTLLMTGDVGRGALVTPELAAEALRLLPAGSRVVQFASGHSIRRAVFQEYMATVSSFLAGCGCE